MRVAAAADPLVIPEQAANFVYTLAQMKGLGWKGLQLNIDICLE